MNRSSARTLLCLLALLLPFDLARPTLRLAGFTFTFVYLSTLVVLAATVGAWLKMTADRRRTTAGECHAKTQRRQGAKLGRFPASWCAVVMGSAVRSLMPAVVLVAVMGLSAWQAPVFYPEAISFTVRTAVGVSLAAATAFLLRDARDVARLTRWVVVGALVVAALGMLEYAGVAAVERLLEPFRNQVSRVGGRVRISSTLPYPTITSQYLEMALPLLVAWLLGSPPTRPQTAVGSRPPGVVRRLWHRARPALLLAGAALLAEAIVLTFTRAALVGVAAALGLMALMAWRGRVEGEYAPVRAAATALMLLPVLLSLTAFVDPVVLLRLTRERDAGWLQAAYAAPQELAAPAGASVEVSVGITITGLLA
ncbi:MAG TPA: hypothetical protein VER55_14740, partial [Ardenticatenaceae bacterium]|nr:hypothetical protein [Ardenticatenaceae bacterium]